MEAQRIQDLLARAWHGPAWHGPSLDEVLEGVAARSAARRPLPHAHSIWELVLHLTAWERVVVRRLAGETVALTDAEDWPAVEDGADWEEALEALELGHRALYEAIENVDAARLQATVPGTDYSYYVLLHGAVHHTLYHAGQIALLRKTP